MTLSPNRPPQPNLCRALRLLDLGLPPLQARLPLCEEALALCDLAHCLRLELCLPGFQRLLVRRQLVGALLQGRTAQSSRAARVGIGTGAAEHRLAMQA